MARLIDADAFKADWHMANECQECKQDARNCQYDVIFTRMDVCDMIDSAPTVCEWVSVKGNGKEDDCGKIQELDRDDVRTFDG